MFFSTGKSYFLGKKKQRNVLSMNTNVICTAAYRREQHGYEDMIFNSVKGWKVFGNKCTHIFGRT